MKHIVKICLALTLVCTLMAGALAAIYALTDPIIRENEDRKRAEILEEFFPAMTAYDSLESAVADVEIVYAVRGEDGARIGYCVEVVKAGYAGDVSMMVALTADGTVCGVSLVSHSETKGLSEKQAADALCREFVGKSGEQKFASSGGEIDKIAGATYSSRAVLDGVNDAVRAIGALAEGGAAS